MEILAKYGIQQTFYFPMVVAGGTNLAVAADWTPVTADADYSIDGGTWTQCTNTVAIAVSGAAMWKLTLTAAEMSGTRIAVAIVDAATKAVEDQSLIIHTGLGPQLEATLGIVIGEVETAQTAASTTTMEAHFLAPTTTIEQTDDHYNGRLILWTTGVLTGQMTDITDYTYTNSNADFTFTAVTDTPGDADRFVIL
jgi:hypothetical protein